MNSQFDGSNLPLVVLAALSVVFAVLYHWRIRRLFAASLLAALTSAVSFQIIGFVLIGYLDPFVIVVLVTSFAGSFVLALLVGLLMQYLRG